MGAVELVVSLDVYTRSKTLEEMSALLGRRPTAPSADTASSRPGVRATNWSINSGLAATATLAEHVAGIEAILPPEELEARRQVLPEDTEVFLTIAVFFDLTTPYTLHLTQDVLARITRWRATLDVACHACNPE